MKGKHIADEATAKRIADERTATDGEATVFSYRQDRSGLTMFGVEVVTHINGQRQVETIYFQ